MKTIYLVGVGVYSQRMLLGAFGDQEMAAQYRTHYAEHPLRVIGAPLPPVWIEELTLYESTDEAIEDDAS